MRRGMSCRRDETCMLAVAVCNWLRIYTFHSTAYPYCLFVQFRERVSGIVASRLDRSSSEIFKKFCLQESGRRTCRTLAALSPLGRSRPLAYSPQISFGVSPPEASLLPQSNPASNVVGSRHSRQNGRQKIAAPDQRSPGHQGSRLVLFEHFGRHQPHMCQYWRRRVLQYQW